MLMLFLGLVLGIVLCASSLFGYHTLKQKKHHRLSLASTNYDTRIDKVTESGTMRYKLHKAMNSPSLRIAMKDSPIYEKAASALGWDD